jgi:hypothetical protein
MVVGLDGPIIQEGYIKVPEAKSLAVEFHEAVAREYADTIKETRELTEGS